MSHPLEIATFFLPFIFYFRFTWKNKLLFSRIRLIERVPRTCVRADTDQNVSELFKLNIFIRNFRDCPRLLVRTQESKIFELSIFRCLRCELTVHFQGRPLLELSTFECRFARIDRSINTNIKSSSFTFAIVHFHDSSIFTDRLFSRTVYFQRIVYFESN